MAAVTAAWTAEAVQAAVTAATEPLQSTIEGVRKRLEEMELKLQAQQEDNG